MQQIPGINNQLLPACMPWLLTDLISILLITTTTALLVRSKRKPSVLSKELHDFVVRQTQKYPNVPVIEMTIDSAEGALRNQYLEDFGIRWHPVAKKKKIIMTEYVQSLLANGRFYYFPTENNLKYFIEEHKRYQWDEKTVKDDDPKVIKEDDHTCDAFQYMIVDNAQLLRLKA